MCLPWLDEGNPCIHWIQAIHISTSSWFWYQIVISSLCHTVNLSDVASYHQVGCNYLLVCTFEVTCFMCFWGAHVFMEMIEEVKDAIGNSVWHQESSYIVCIKPPACSVENRTVRIIFRWGIPFMFSIINNIYINL